MECFTLLFDHLTANRASVFEWHKRFKEGRESLRDNLVWFGLVWFGFMAYQPL